MPGRPFAACALASVLDSGKVPGPGLDGEVLGWALGRLPRLFRAPQARNLPKERGKASRRCLAGI